MRVIIDGDIIGYRVGFAAEEESEAIAIARTATFLETMLWEDLENVTSYQGYITGKTNFRNEIAVTAPYKGNRTAPKPKHLAIIREYLVKGWDFMVSENEEADDCIAIDHVENKYQSIIASIDKDFLQLKGKHWNFVKKEMTIVSEEQALLNFYLQVLTGDRTDNIIGLKGIGPVKANKILQYCENATEMYTACVEAYAGAEERVIENARLLYLRRKVGEIWQPPTKEINGNNTELR
jgi:5'-3' exonuclease